jgi:hypothetical protein
MVLFSQLGFYLIRFLFHWPRTSKYPDCRLQQFFGKPFCNQNFALQHFISLNPNHAKPTHKKLRLIGESIRILWCFAFASHAVYLAQKTEKKRSCESCRKWWDLHTRYKCTIDLLLLRRTQEWIYYISYCYDANFFSILCNNFKKSMGNVGGRAVVWLSKSQDVN